MPDFEPHDGAIAELTRRAGELRDEIERHRLAQRGEINDGRQSGAWDNKDQADVSEAAFLGDAELDRAIAELREIEMAQARIANGVYGQCVTCGAVIGPERLKVQPAASRCMSCQAAAELAPN